MPIAAISFWRWPIVLALLGFLLAAGTAEAALGESAGRRVALVIGNSDYRSVPKLKNAAGDATEIAKTLTSLGFEVIDRTNVSRTEFSSALEEFYASAVDADAAVIYYSGHGFQLNGANYLVPVDATLTDRSRMGEETMRLDEIARRAQSANRQTLIFLDACRNNPLPESVRALSAGEGLAQLETGSGIYIAFATQPGNISRDGAGAHSPFTSALLEHMPTPGISISDMMIRVRNSVEKATLHTQIPWEQTSLRSQFYFNPEPEAEADGELTDEDREMLLALDPAMRRKFEAKFGIRIDEGDKPLNDVPDDTPAIKPTMRIEAAEDDENVAETENSSGAGEDPLLGATLRILPGVTPETPGSLEASIPATRAEERSDNATAVAPASTITAALPGGTVTAAGTPDVSMARSRGDTASTASSTTPKTMTVAAYDPATKPLVANKSFAQSQAKPSAPAERAAPELTIAATTSPSVLAATKERTRDIGARAGSSDYEIAALSSAERAVAQRGGAASSVAPVASDWQRVVGEEVRLAASATPETAMRATATTTVTPPATTAQNSAAPATFAGAATTVAEAELRVASLDPAEINQLSKRPEDLPEGAPGAGAADVNVPGDLPAAVQKELARLGCYRGTVDGDWGSGSARALLRYYATKKTDPDLLEPDASLFARLSDEDTVVCTRTETKPAVEPSRKPTVAGPRNTRPPAQARPAEPRKLRIAQPPKPPKAVQRTIATRPARAAPAKREAAAGAPAQKTLKKSLTMGAFR